MARLVRLCMLVPALMAVSSSASVRAESLSSPVRGDLHVTSVRFGKSATPLNGPWHFQTGDSPRDPSSGAPLWAQPEFNDSGWETVDLTPKPGLSDPFDGDPRYVRGWTTLGHPGYTGYAWYRLQIRTDEAPGEQLALIGPYMADDGFQLYVDGTLLGELGEFRSSGKSPIVYQPRPVMFVPVASGGVRLARHICTQLPLGRGWDRSVCCTCPTPGACIMRLRLAA